MSDLMDITELDLNDTGFGRSSNFGGGLELLMNDKVRESNRPTSDIDLDDLNKALWYLQREISFRQKD